MNDRLNLWRKHTYHDPRAVLRRLRALEVELAGVDLDERVRTLRTNKLNKYREWRDAAIFTYGMGLARSTPMLYATDSSGDYDFVTFWSANGEDHFCPVQLKELPPESINANATLGGLIDSFGKYATPTDTVLAIKLNRKPELELTTLRVTGTSFKEVYSFWATAPGSTRWLLYGDLARTPGAFTFDYPD